MNSNHTGTRPLDAFQCEVIMNWNNAKVVTDKMVVDAKCMFGIPLDWGAAVHGSRSDDAAFKSRPPSCHTYNGVRTQMWTMAIVASKCGTPDLKALMALPTSAVVGGTAVVRLVEVFRAEESVADEIEPCGVRRKLVTKEGTFLHVNTPEALANCKAVVSRAVLNEFSGTLCDHLEQALLFLWQRHAMDTTYLDATAQVRDKVRAALREADLEEMTAVMTHVADLMMRSFARIQNVENRSHRDMRSFLGHIASLLAERRCLVYEHHDNQSPRCVIKVLEILRGDARLTEADCLARVDDPEILLARTLDARLQECRKLARGAGLHPRDVDACSVFYRYNR